MKLRLLLVISFATVVARPLAAEDEWFLRPATPQGEQEEQARGASARAGEEETVRRGALERQGRAWVERAHCEAAVREGGRLILRADSGSINVKPGRNDRMECQVRLRAYLPSEEEARRYLSSFELSLRQLEGGAVMVVGRFRHERVHSGRLAVSYQVSVPLKFNVDLESKGGELSVETLQGEFRGTTAGGDIQGGDITGPVFVETAGGDIELGNIGQKLEARTAGGGIRVGNVKSDATLETSGGEIVAGLIEGAVRAATAGGDIVLRGASGPVRAETAGGQIQLGECGSSIRAETAGGSIRLRGARGMVEAETAGGSIDLFRLQSAVRASTTAGRILAELNANRDTFAASKLETAVGDVQVFLPVDLPLNIDAAIEEAFGHKIVSDFPLRLVGGNEEFRHRPQRGEAALNGGGKILRIRTVMGNIEILKLDSPVLKQIKMRQESLWERRQEPRPRRVRTIDNEKEDKEE